MTPKQVVKHYGSQSKAAKAIGRTRATISYWVRVTKQVPYPVQHLIQNKTGGALRADG